jgi:hypothetical protein
MTAQRSNSRQSVVGTPNVIVPALVLETMLPLLLIVMFCVKSRAPVMSTRV